jgi:transcriptional regulator of acetoin/glycerol metabolism
MRGRILICGEGAPHDLSIVGAFQSSGYEVQACDDWHHWREVATKTSPDLLVIELGDGHLKQDLGLRRNGGNGNGNGGHLLPPDGGFKLPDAGVDLAELEKSLLMQALERTGGNQSAAARLLGISRYALRYRVEKYNL